MNKIALISSFPPSNASLNEYGYHLAIAMAESPAVEKLFVIADRECGQPAEVISHPKIEILRCWSFNKSCSAFSIVKALKQHNITSALFNIQSATFGDREIPAAFGLMTPLLSRIAGINCGIILHNVIDMVDLEKTNIGKNYIRAAMIKIAGRLITKSMLAANYLTVTLDSIYDVLKKNYQAENIYMVPHGSFSAPEFSITPVASRDPIIVTMGKFGTYKRLERLVSAFQAYIKRHPHSNAKLIIGGSNHPSTPGYLDSIREKIADEPNIILQGYIEEEEVANFFSQAQLAIFDYDSTTGSSGVLHQAAGFGTPVAFPLIGDFIDVKEREGIQGFLFKAMDERAITAIIEEALEDLSVAQRMVDSNLALSRSMPMDIIATFHTRLLDRHKKGRLLQLRIATA
ncbi:MAG: glycosyltransferase [bacterium]